MLLDKKASEPEPKAEVFILCDGSTIEYTPEYEQDFCDCCGSATGESEINEPDFHGKRVWREGRLFCERCGEEFCELEKCNQILKERMIPAIVKQLQKTNDFYAYVKGRR